MPPKFNIDALVYAVVVILFVIILILVLVSPAQFTNMKNAYQGF